MSTTRLAAAGICLLAAAFMAAGGAAAQTAPGKPIQLLPVLTQPERATPHAKAAHKRLSKAHGRSHFAAAIKAAKHAAHARRATARETEAAPVAAPAAVWPAPAAEPAPATPATAADATDRDLSEVVVGGRAVQIVSPTQANDLDLAADLRAGPTATGTTAMDAEARTAPKTAAFTVRTPVQAGTVGSTSWIAQVLAALGGAVAAGSIAWFLIGGAPHRMYG